MDLIYPAKCYGGTKGKKMPFLPGKLHLGPPAKLPADIRPGLLRRKGCALMVCRAHFSLAPTTHNKVCLLDESVFKMMA